MTTQAIKDVPFILSDVDEEAYSILSLEDLITEYNEEIRRGPTFIRNTRQPLSLHVPMLQGDQTIIRAMTKAEIESMDYQRRSQYRWAVAEKVVKDQITIRGGIGNIPNILDGITLSRLLKELGLTGKVYYKTVEEKIYVIIKGNPRLRGFLTGTRYGNWNPKVISLGLAKVNVATAIKAGTKKSIWIYCPIKAYDAAKMIWEDGELKPSFFKEIPADGVKLALGLLATVGIGIAVLALGIPTAIGAAAAAGLVLVLSVVVGIAIEIADQLTGFTKTISQAVETVWDNLKSWWTSHGTKQKTLQLQPASNAGNTYLKGPDRNPRTPPRISGSDFQHFEMPLIGLKQSLPELDDLLSGFLFTRPYYTTGQQIIPYKDKSLGPLRLYTTKPKTNE